MIRQLDQKGSHDYSVINLRYGWVMDAAEVLNNAMSRGQAKGAAGAQVIADARTNRLIILGRRRRAPSWQLAQSLDTPDRALGQHPGIRLRHNDAKTLAETLGQISEGMKNNGGQGGEQTGGGRPSNILIRADESTNALVLLADPDTVNALEDIVRQPDVPRAQVLGSGHRRDLRRHPGCRRRAMGDQQGRHGRNQDQLRQYWTVHRHPAAIAREQQGTGIHPRRRHRRHRQQQLRRAGHRALGQHQANLLSTPSLLTLDNQKAEILVGQNVPFQTGSYTTNSEGSSNPFTTVERIGVSPKVTRTSTTARPCAWRSSRRSRPCCPTPSSATIPT